LIIYFNVHILPWKYMCVKSYYDIPTNMKIMHLITMWFNLFYFLKLLKTFHFFHIGKFQKYHEIKNCAKHNKSSQCVMFYAHIYFILFYFILFFNFLKTSNAFSIITQHVFIKMSNWFLIIIIWSYTSKKKLKCNKLNYNYMQIIVRCN